MLTCEDIKNAYKCIEEHIMMTPLEKSYILSDDESQVYLKLENLQPHVKSFKIRGAMSKLTNLSIEEMEKGVTAISSGNHGASLAYASKKLGVGKTVIFVPESTPEPKIEKMKIQGAMVVKHGQNYDEAHAFGNERIKESGLIEVNPCEDPVCIAGHGTIAIEILQQQPDIDVILVPIGGGGLITGISTYAKSVNPEIEVIGVQTKASPAMLVSMKAGICHEYFHVEDSICDAVIGGIARLPFELSAKCIDKVLLVEEEQIRKSVAEMVLFEKIVCEPSSAIVYSAYKKYKEYFKGKKVALVISGGNVESSLLQELVTKYKSVEGE